MYTIIYFSPTGNAAYLAEKLSQCIGQECSTPIAMEFVDAEALTKNDHLIIMYPVHAFNAPRTVIRFVKGLPAGLYNSVSLIGVGSSLSWLNDATSIDLKRILERKNYPIIVDEHMAMPLTIIMAFKDPLSLKMIKESDCRILDICKDIVAGTKSRHSIKIKSKVVNLLGKGEQVAAKLFGLELHANNRCTSCGRCWQNCPENNIKEGKNGKPHFGFSCLMCMRCIYNCPEHAISPRFSKFLPISKGYSINKYIDSNTNPSDQ